MAEKCVHKGCGKVFTDADEPCVYHPGPPIFHEGQKGWKCCKTRVLTFDEFLTIPPCTTGKHSTVDDTPVESKNEAADVPDSTPAAPVGTTKPIAVSAALPPSLSASGAHTPTPRGTPAPPESESDDPSLEIQQGATCRRKGCGKTYSGSGAREGEECVHHPGQPIFHEGSKGWTCCKRRVLEFDEFLNLPGCKTKDRHLFIGKGVKSAEEKVKDVRTDFYQTSSTVIASVYLKKVIREDSRVSFSSPTTIDLDLPTADHKRYEDTFTLFAPIDTEKSFYKIMSTKLEFTLVKATEDSWPTLRSTDPRTGEIIQTGRPTRA
ncbi:hypothetical protein MauCBS54593_003138 [Microsporum audouinii]